MCVCVCIYIYIYIYTNITEVYTEKSVISKTYIYRTK